MSRQAAAVVRKIRGGRKAIVSRELDQLKDILMRSPVAISNAELAVLLWGPLKRQDELEKARRERLIRKRVQQLRTGGAPIALALGKSGGYLWVTAATPEGVQFLRATSGMLDARADTSHKLAARLVGPRSGGVSGSACGGADRCGGARGDSAFGDPKCRIAER